MARTIKKGLDYFPFDVDFFQDIRIRKLIKYQGGKAVAVYALLLCTIYKNGYYVEWDKELPFIISEQSGYTEAYIQEVVDCCLNIGLLSKELFESVKVLTSKGIQERYSRICSSLRRSCVITEYNLISAEKNTQKAQQPMSHSEKQSQQPKVARYKPTSPQPGEQSAPATPAHPSHKYASTVNEEVAEMKRNAQWKESVCVRYQLNDKQFDSMLADFALNCDKQHTSMQDAQSHFCRWLAKKAAAPKVSKAAEIAMEREKERAKRLKEEKEHASQVVHPDDYLKSQGLKPGTSMAEVARGRVKSKKASEGDELPADVRAALNQINDMN